MDSSMGDQGPGKMPMMGNSDIRIPAQVDVAFVFLRWANIICNGRTLRVSEKIVYDAALEVLRLYLTGEMTFVGEEADYENDSDESKHAEPCFFCKDKS